MSSLSRRLALVLASVVLAACGDGATDSGSPGGGGGFKGSIDLAVTDAGRCDPLDRRHCLFPMPSDFFTHLDPATDTGLRLAFPPDGMPTNQIGRASCRERV